MFQLNQRNLLWVSFGAICYFSFSSLWNFWATFDVSIDAAIGRHIDFIWTTEHNEADKRVKNILLYSWLAGELFIATLKLAIPGIILLLATKFVVRPVDGAIVLSFRDCICAPHIQVFMLIPISGIAYLFGSS